MQRSLYSKIVAASAFGVFAIVWYFLIAPQVTKLPADFHYVASIISIDNFYDEATGEYQGPQRSSTEFSYRVAGSEDGVLQVENTFQVSTLLGEPIFATTRTYGIHPQSCAHVPGYGDRSRIGHLFAPKGLTPRTTFTYWHVNYDAPATMEFVSKEVLFGLPVLRFRSTYDARVDQTENLTNLPGVGETRGVHVEPVVDVWVEPVTGYLVRYQDEATAYYYDLETGEDIAPWNSFSNRTARESVREQVGIAQELKLQELVVQYVVPAVLLIIAGAILLAYFGASIAAGAGVLGLVLLGGWLWLTLTPQQDTEVVRVGILRWSDSASVERNVDGFKEVLTSSGYTEGESIEFVDMPSSGGDPDRHQQHVEILRAQEVDLIYSLTTPGSQIVQEAVTDIPVIFSVVTYPVESGIVESLVDSGNNFAGTRLWVSVEEQMSVLLEVMPDIQTIGFMRRSNESNSEVQLAEFNQWAEDHDVAVADIVVEPGFVPEEALLPYQDELDVVYLACDTLVQNGQVLDQLVPYLLEARIPASSCSGLAVEKGALISVAANIPQLGEISGRKAALALQGIPPRLLGTTSSPRTFMYLNTETATRLNILLSQKLITSAFEIYPE